MAISLPWLGNSNAMNANPSPDAAADQIYEDVSPQYRWLIGDKANTLIIDLGGVKKKGGEFEKEHLLVQIDDSGILVVSGRRHLDGRRWRRFQTSHTLPYASDVSRIRATFDGSLLSIIVPKLAAHRSPPETGGTVVSGEKKAEEKPSGDGGGTKAAEAEKEPVLRAREEKSGSASEAKKPEEKKKKTEVPRAEEREETPPHLKAQTAGPNSRTAARRETAADPQSPPADRPRRRRRSSPAAKFTRREATERELVLNVVAAAAVLLALGLYLVYRYRSIVDSRELLPISAV